MARAVRVLPGCALLALALALPACGGGEDEKTGTVTVSVVPMSIDDGGAMAMVTVTVMDSAGAPATGAVTLSASAGGFTGGSGHGAILTLTAGSASAMFSCRRATDDGCVGTVTISARWNAASGQSSLMIMSIPDAGPDAAIDAAIDAAVDASFDAAPMDAGTPQLSWLSTTCNGNACTIMGIRGSGFNENAHVRFRLVDAAGRPIMNATVTFSIFMPPMGTVVTASDVSNADGQVTAIVNSGLSIGVFTVKATYISGLVETISPTIGIRGAKAANDSFQIACDRINIGAYVSPTPPRIDTASCRVILTDRYGNFVGTGTSVSLKAEAGSVPNSVATKAFDPTGPNTDEGRGDFLFSTAGLFPAVDVAPLPANAAQYPLARAAEPSQVVGALTTNPRDGLVTLMAYVRGEEKFYDDNANGMRDSTPPNVERFIDQGEAFVDANDSNVWDIGETFIDDAPANGVWDGPNGRWDADTTIWTEIHIVYTGRPLGGLPTSEVIPARYAGTCAAMTALPRATVQNLAIIWGDINFNPPQSASTFFGISHLSTKGSVDNQTPMLLDGYGFGRQRILVSASTGTGCTATTPACEWRVQFTDWRRVTQLARVAGAPVSDTTGCEDDTATVTATVLGGQTQINVLGALD